MTTGSTRIRRVGGWCLGASLLLIVSCTPLSDDVSSSASPGSKATDLPSATVTTSPSVEGTEVSSQHDQVELDAPNGDHSDPNQALLGITALAMSLVDIRPLGWDETHGAPYSSFLYERASVIYSITAVHSTERDLGEAIVLGEGRRLPLSRTVVSAHGAELTHFETAIEGITTQVVVAESICSAYDVWATAADDTPDQVIADLGDVVEAINCDE